MKATLRDAKGGYIVAKVARSTSFSLERLSKDKTVSKGRERYIKDVSAKALSSISI